MERTLAVSYVPGSARHIPSIRIQGLWLLKSGFCRGDKVRLTVERDKIIITKIQTKPTTQESPRYAQQNLYGEL